MTLVKCSSWKVFELNPQNLNICNIQFDFIHFVGQIRSLSVMVQKLFWQFLDKSLKYIDCWNLWHDRN